MRLLTGLLFAATACSQGSATDPSEQAKSACAHRARGVDRNTMTAPYDDCIAAQANQAPAAQRARICKLASAGVMTNDRCSIDTE
jgi:hypothetical protein